jgi:hypothetical protein
MRKSELAFYVCEWGLYCLLVAGATVSLADEAPAVAGADARITNMTCRPFPSSQKQLPPSEWNECVGAHTYENGNVYHGQFRHGDRDGFGVLEIKFIGHSSDNLIGWDKPAIYVGSFRGGRLNGHGLLMSKSGAAYAGTFKNNIAQSDFVRKECAGGISTGWTNCIGVYRFANGNVYRGEFTDGLPNGIGMLQVNTTDTSDFTQVKLPVPGVYVGEFKGGNLSGQRAVSMPDAGYLGALLDTTSDTR